ncbi:Na+/H+ antiporter NhaA [Pedobacter sp. GR22-6]|uniref:Na+/H+ antiporter NhaA n=1 Tax=Pedobacter sp. GR22-6 TaxID=3127957 RepID=UPI00307E8B64
MASHINLNIFKQFFKSGSASGIIIFGCVILSIIGANSSLAGAFQSFLGTEIGYSSDRLHLRYPIQLWINDGLMAIFFLMVGLEIKREMVEGELSSPKKSLLPILCALGGASVPALIYTVLNRDQPTAEGWGIPMATDIAFALAIVATLNKRVPPSLKIFLAALAIVDDLMAIFVIAIFYAGELHSIYLLYSGVILLLLFLLNRFKVTSLAFYLLPGAVLWYFVHHSGIHATIAGVLTALFIPTNTTSDESPLEKLEHFLTTPVNFLIVPIFAFANTNITFQNEMIGGLGSTLGMGIILGLVLGKPTGIMLMSWISVKTGLCQLPENANWKHVLGVGFIAGIGFTMSIFMAVLSFSDALLISEAKFSVLCASVIAALTGYLILRGPKRLTSKYNR